MSSSDNLADDADLEAKIQASSSEHPVPTTLRTDEQVLARVTDGIYRQPGSAIRELISNAYDADASKVIIRTDRPRFEQITIEDDGIGMSPAALAHLVLHIGGSAKRNQLGADLGLTKSDDVERSPSGRKLIGKIGIGLFSVSQLTQSFQIITKTSDDDHRTVATVVLKQYSDDPLDPADKYEAGKVVIWREPAADQDTQGTTIVLNGIRPQTRGTLQSIDMWRGIEQNEKILAAGDRQDLKPPTFHIGRSRQGNSDLLRTDPVGRAKLPWDPAGDSSSVAFQKLVDSVWDEANHGTPNPRLERIFDYYLQMVWQLSLAVPLRYYDENPLDIKFGNDAYVYRLSQATKEAPRKIDLGADETIRDALNLGPDTSTPSDFSVIIDDLELARPLRFRNLPTGSNAVKKPIVLAASCKEAFDGVPREISGGPLEFRAYLLWTPKVVPTEHQGVLIRINGASGTVFDPTFMRYQVSEQTRLRQTTCEILVTRGLDSALNIDRESFNFAHPHVVYLTRWLHMALRRLATLQKSIAADLRRDQRSESSEKGGQRLQDIVDSDWSAATDYDGSEPPPVAFTESGERQPSSGGYGFDREQVFGPKTATRGARQRAEQIELELRLQSIAQVLATYRVLDTLEPVQQIAMLRSIRKILETEF